MISAQSSCDFECHLCKGQACSVPGFCKQEGKTQSNDRGECHLPSQPLRPACRGASATWAPLCILLLVSRGLGQCDSGITHSPGNSTEWLSWPVRDRSTVDLSSSVGPVPWELLTPRGPSCPAKDGLSSSAGCSSFSMSTCSRIQPTTHLF